VLTEDTISVVYCFHSVRFKL